MRRYQMTMYLFREMAKDFFQRLLWNLTDEQKRIRDQTVNVRKSCLEQVDDIYCHHYFQRCYISSIPQPLCREACEELVFRQCDREFKLALDFNRKRQQFPEWPFFWDVISCTTLPFRNESSNCYYPDKIRGQFTNRGIWGTGGDLALIINLTVVQALSYTLMRYFFVNKGV